MKLENCPAYIREWIDEKKIERDAPAQLEGSGSVRAA
jgi:hypothetical protein